jgi:hypothetical protein
MLVVDIHPTRLYLMMLSRTKPVVQSETDSNSRSPLSDRFIWELRFDTDGSYNMEYRRFQSGTNDYTNNDEQTEHGAAKMR